MSPCKTGTCSAVTIHALFYVLGYFSFCNILRPKIACLAARLNEELKMSEGFFAIDILGKELQNRMLTFVRLLIMTSRKLCLLKHFISDMLIWAQCSTSMCILVHEQTEKKGFRFWRCSTLSLTTALSSICYCLCWTFWSKSLFFQRFPFPDLGLRVCWWRSQVTILKHC